ncbi:MAG TPA: alpha-ketoacid dehydrogenase subunit beta [Anaerovoracaceae bacterium]|nr:alpha-ketoacid dehydrogenase subunit beta [Anaerovoracaceae bacterium]
MREIMMMQAVNEAQMEEMERDPSTFLIGLDVGKMGGVLGQDMGLYEKFGEDRVIDAPIGESGYAGFALGAALAGKRPIVEMQFADFSILAVDPIGNGAKIRYCSGGQYKAPVVFRCPQGAGLMAAATHSQCIESWFANFPGLKIVIPSTPYDMKGLLKTAIRDDDPVLFLEHKAMYGIKGAVPEEEYTIPLGQAKVVREGKDVTVIAIQALVYQAIDAANELEKEGISVEIIDPRTLIPLDTDTIGTSVAKTGKVVIAHEAPKRGGFGGEISAVISEKFFSSLKAPIIRVGAANCPLPFNILSHIILKHSNISIRSKMSKIYSSAVLCSRPWVLLC